MQWLCLRRHASGTIWWIPATAIAALGLLAAATGAYKIPQVGLIGALAKTGIMVAGGAVAGTLQWLILRKKSDRAIWWIAASAVSWGLCPIVQSTAPFGDGDLGAIGMTVAIMALVGAITGGTLAWLLRLKRG